MLIPVTFEINILNQLFLSAENQNIPITTNVSTSNQIHNPYLINELEISQNTVGNIINNDNIYKTNIFYEYLIIVKENLWFIWLFASAILLLKKITSYHIYVRHLKLNRKIITDKNIITTYDEVCYRAKIKRKIGIYSFKTISSPMLIGFIKPYILLPDAMLKNLECLRYVFLHELTHYRRLDFLYKWLVQIAVCVHFFNPFVYIVRKSINKTCEFSCDETVIGKLDETSKKAYGTALIGALELNIGCNQQAISFMLCEDVKIIKERLGAIMKQ